MPFEVLNALLSIPASICIDPIIDTLKENLDQGFKTPGVMIEKTETQKHCQPSLPSQP